MDCTEYAETKRKAAKKISADIRERWNNRIVQRGLHLMGEAGAVQYLSDYGRGIGTAKVISFALCAESEGYPEMAIGFWNWRKADRPQCSKQFYHRSRDGCKINFRCPK